MKIGWCKLSMFMEINYNVAENGFGEERPMLFKNFLDHGHQVKLLTPLCKRDRNLLNKVYNGTYKSLPPSEGVDHFWMKGLEYDPAGYADGCDVLVVENGPLNITFRDSNTDQPCIRRMVDIINKFEGLVLFYQSDPLLPFPFWRLTMAERQWSHTDNTVRQTGKGIESDGWADYDEIFKDKKIVCLGKSSRVINEPEYVVDCMDGPRFRYRHFFDEGLIKFDFLPTGYDPWFIRNINFDFENRLSCLVYFGFPRSRVQEFRKAYSDFAKRTVIYGPWRNGEDREKILLDCLSEGMCYGGFLDGFIEVAKTYGKFKVNMNLIPKRAQDLGWISNRFFESIFCGCITIGDPKTWGIKDYCIGELIEDPKYIEYNDLIRKILNLSNNEYTCLADKQFNKVKHLDYHFITDYFENICKKYI